MSLQEKNTIQPVKQRFKLDQDIVDDLRTRTPKFGFNGLGEVVFRRTYSRNNEDWCDVVIRVIEGVMSIRKEHYFRNSLRWVDNEWQKFARNMAVSMFNMQWLPPGRGLWMMGTDYCYRRGSMALNNCGATDTKEDLVLSAEWTMDALMNGVGVGFTTNWRGEATKPNKDDTELYVIEDSREGWCMSLVKLLCSYIDSPRYGKNKFPVFDYSQIRPAGEPIKGFGGQASGSGPLEKMHARIEKFLDYFCEGKCPVFSQDEKFQLVETDETKPYSHTRLVADIFNSIGACVVAGNVRRSAEICMGSVEDIDFVNLKNYTENPERGEIGWMSNNSVVLEEGYDFHDFTHIPEMAKRIKDNGEPGMINLYNIQRFGRYGKEMKDEANLVNPCITADTWITTENGAIQVKDLINKPFKAKVDGKLYDCTTGFFPTGCKDIFKLVTSEGFELKATSNHKIMTVDGGWVEMGDLKEGDKIRVHQHEFNEDIDEKKSLDGKNFADIFTKNLIHTTKSELLENVERADSSFFIRGFLSKLFDTNGSTIRFAYDIEYLKPIQRMILRFGIFSKIHSKSETEKELVISGYDVKLFYEKICPTELNEYIKLLQFEPLSNRYEATVKSIKQIGKDEVYDATVNDIHAFDANGLYVHNCGEISLCNYELCNLSETFPPRCESPEQFNDAIKFATFYSSTVSLLPSHRSETNAIMAKNRRIGVSVSGIAQWASSEVPEGWGQMNYTRMTKYLREGYKIVREENKRLAESAGVPASIRVTTVKPSGSISLLVGVTPGVHYPVSEYAIRRMRIGADSPLVQPLKDANIPHEKDQYSDNTLVFEFAIHHGSVRPCEQVSPWEQFSLVAMMQRCWADNCVSATVYFDREKDGDDIEKLLAMYIPTLKSVSMLPHNKGVYAQAPYENIDREEYERRLNEYTLPDFHKVENNVPVGSKFCTGENCEL